VRQDGREGRYPDGRDDHSGQLSPYRDPLRHGRSLSATGRVATDNRYP
jgi:hypothetical protein